MSWEPCLPWAVGDPSLADSFLSRVWSMVKAEDAKTGRGGRAARPGEASLMELFFFFSNAYSFGFAQRNEPVRHVACPALKQLLENWQ